MRKGGIVAGAADESAIQRGQHPLDVHDLGTAQRPELRNLDLDWQKVVRLGRCQMDRQGAENLAERHNAIVRAKMEFPFR